jgi:hypothetical protein
MTTPQTFTMASLPATSTGPEVPRPVMRRRVRTAIQPISSGFELAGSIEGL